MKTVDRGSGRSCVPVRTALTVIRVALFGLAGCSSGNSSGSRTSATSAPTASTRARPPGPAADLSTELTGGRSAYMGEGTAVDLTRAGYVQHEYAAAGTAA